MPIMLRTRLRKSLTVLLGLVFLLGALAGGQQISQAAGDYLPGISCLRGSDLINQRLTELVNLHPSLADLVDIGDSWEKIDLVGSALGDDLRVLRLTNQSVPGSKPIFFSLSGIDARDVLGVELNLRFAEKLLEGYGVDPDITMVLDTSEVHLLVVANPDGKRELERQLGQLPVGSLTWSAAWGRNRNLSICQGVDLTRNFDFDFTPNLYCEAAYPGAFAESEPEAQSIAAYTRELYADMRGHPGAEVDENSMGLVINLSEWDDMPHIIYPYFSVYPHDPDGSKDWIYLLASKLANIPGDMDFFRAQLGYTNNPTRYGNVVDYVYGELGVPALNFRLKRPILLNKFPTCNEFEGDVVNLWLDALMMAARAVGRPYEFGQGPEITGALAASSPTELFSQDWAVNGNAHAQYYQEVPANKLPAGLNTVHVTKLKPEWQEGAMRAGGLTLREPKLPHQQEFLAELEFVGGETTRQVIYFQAENQEGKLGIPRAVFIWETHYLAMPLTIR